VEKGTRIILSVIVVGMVLLQSSWFFTAVSLMAVAAFWAAATGSRREWLIWIAMLVGFALFADLRARMGPLVNPNPYYLYVIELETLGGLIGVPTTWLQQHIQPSVLNTRGMLDAFLTAVYISFFITPQFVVVYLWRKGGPFPRYVAAACLLLAGALVVHFLLPTAPPWMAAEKGLIPEVVRIEHELLNAIYPGLTAGGYAASANDVAAMPSVHLGLTVLPMMAMASSDHAPRHHLPRGALRGGRCRGRRHGLGGLVVGGSLPPEKTDPGRVGQRPRGSVRGQRPTGSGSPQKRSSTFR
jgi:hypothetical protein